jgi:hypothetical protein
MRSDPLARLSTPHLEDLYRELDVIRQGLEGRFPAEAEAIYGPPARLIYQTILARPAPITETELRALWGDR